MSNGSVFAHENKIIQLRTHTNLPFSPSSDEQKIYCQSCGTNLGLKSQPKHSRHSEECLVKISDEKTQGVRRSKSQTEGEKNWSSENKTSLLFSLVSSFCDFFMDMPP